MGDAHELLTYAREALLERIAGAKARIWLAGPFISLPIANRICEAAAAADAGDRRLLTDLDERAVRCGVLDPEALAKLRGCHFEVASLGNLHAKLSIVDSGWALVGSGNLTGSGLGREDGDGNYEMGVLLSPGQRSLARAVFADWWEKAELVTAEQIAEFDELPRFKTGRRRVGPALAPPAESSLEEILAEDPVTAASRRYWINSNYHNPDDEKWWKRGWVSDWAEMSYKKGDLLVVYLGKKNHGPSRCTAVLRVTRPPRYEPEFVRKERDLEAEKRWPWVTRTTCVGDVVPSQGVPLELADLTYRSVQRGCELDRDQFQALSEALRAAR